MRCPKCHYLSFEPEARCRNCGYDFALAQVDLEGDLSMDWPDAAGSLADLDLHQRTSSFRPAAAGALGLDLATHLTERRAGSAAAAAVALSDPPPARDMPPAPRVVPPRPPTTTTELPLFVRGLPPPELPAGDPAFDTPLVLVPPAPRPPLSVRRRSPEPEPPPPRTFLDAPVAVSRTAPLTAMASTRSGGAEYARLLDVPQDDPVWAPLSPEDQQRLADEAQGASSTETVSAGQRLTAALVDAALLLAIDAGIVWFTLRICALTIGQAAALPLLPLAAFCVLLDVGYMLMFTATSGQTVGKMAAGIRVVDTSSGTAAASGHVTVRQATLRAILTLPSLLAAGAGFVPALVGKGPAVHDRLSHTRVVRT